MGEQQPSAIGHTHARRRAITSTRTARSSAVLVPRLGTPSINARSGGCTAIGHGQVRTLTYADRGLRFVALARLPLCPVYPHRRSARASFFSITSALRTAVFSYLPSWIGTVGNSVRPASRSRQDRVGAGAIPRLEGISSEQKAGLRALGCLGAFRAVLRLWGELRHLLSCPTSSPHDNVNVMYIYNLLLGMRQSSSTSSKLCFMSSSSRPQNSIFQPFHSTTAVSSVIVAARLTASGPSELNSFAILSFDTGCRRDGLPSTFPSISS